MTMTTEDFLEHHGVRGMKWGVRRQNRLARVQRVASGKGSGLDKVRVAAKETSLVSLHRSGGLKNAAANRAKVLQQRKARIEKGQGTVKDFLALHGADKLAIIGPKSGGSSGPKTTHQKAVEHHVSAGRVLTGAMIGGTAGLTVAALAMGR